MNYTDAGYVYAIRNTVNGGMYVGSTTAFKSRWHTHRSALRRGIHHSFVLQRAWNKYGESAFEFKVLVVCPRSERIEYENRLMPLQRYNVLRTAKESIVRGGWSHSAEFKKKMSVLHKGKKLSDEHKAKLSAAAVGRTYDIDFREKAKLRQLGVKPADETRARLSESVKRARAAQKEKNIQIAKRMYAEAASGVPLSVVFAGAPMSRSTFYNCCKELGLPTLKRKKGGS